MHLRGSSTVYDHGLANECLYVTARQQASLASEWLRRICSRIGGLALCPQEKRCSRGFLEEHHYQAH